PGLVRDLDLDGPHGDAHRVLPRPREMRQRIAAEPAGVDRLQRFPLRVVRPLVEIDDEAPGRAGLVVVVARRQRDGEAVERDVVRVAALDHPREHAQALAVRRAAARDPVDPAAGADRVAVARLEVAAADPPAHCATAARAASRSSARRSRGPAQTTSSAGQSMHANSLGVGGNSPPLIRAIAAESSASRAPTSPAPNTVATGASGRSRNAY